MRNEERESSCKLCETTSYNVLGTSPAFLCEFFEHGQTTGGVLRKDGSAIVDDDVLAIAPSFELLLLVWVRIECVSELFQIGRRAFEDYCWNTEVQGSHYSRASKLGCYS